MMFHKSDSKEQTEPWVSQNSALQSTQWSVWVFLESAHESRGQCWQPQKNSFRIITENDAEAFFSKEQPIPPSFQHIILPLWNPCMRAALVKGPTLWLMGLEHAKSCQRSVRRKCSIIVTSLRYNVMSSTGRIPHSNYTILQSHTEMTRTVKL